MHSRPPQGPYGLVNLWDSMPDVWRSLDYANVYVHISGAEWIITEASSTAILHRDAGRRGGYSCSCSSGTVCRHVRALVALNL